MGLIGGYVSSEQLPQEALFETLSDYSRAGQSGESIVTIREHGIGGHVFSLGTADGIASPALAEAESGDLILSLGYQRQPLATALAQTSTAADLTGFEGEFALICVRRRERAVYLVNDRFAARPMYVYKSAGKVAFATDLNFLIRFLERPPAPDWTGWFEVFKFGHTLESRTTFDGVRKLRPATIVELSGGDVRERQYWRLQHEPQERLELGAFSEQVFAAFSDGMKWREQLLPESQQRVVPLSGGLDSRLVAGAISRPDSCVALTRGRLQSPEAIVAGDVARILGLEHRLIQLDTAPLSSVAEELTRLTGGLIPIHHPAKTLQRADVIRSGGGVTFGGEPGDVLAGSYVPSAAYLGPGRTAALIDKYCRQRGIEIRQLKRIMDGEALRIGYPAVSRELRASFGAVEGMTAAHAVTAWAMRVRQPSFSFMSPFCQMDDIFQLFPHLDYAYSDLMLQLPARWLHQEGFYKSMIYNEIPELQSVPYANTGELLRGSVPAPGFRDQVTRIVDDARAVVPGSAVDLLRFIKHRSSGGEVGGMFDYLRRDDELMSETAAIIDSASDLAEFIDRSAASAFIERCVAGRELNISAATEMLGSLATLAIWYKSYYA